PRAPPAMAGLLHPGYPLQRRGAGGGVRGRGFRPAGRRILAVGRGEYPVRLVALDTLVPSQVGGLLCEERLGWLAARLAEAPDRPTVIFMHHPPFVTGIAHMDSYGLPSAREFAEVVRRHPQVERILCGHLHRPIQARVGGTLASTAPSTAHQVALDLEDDNPLMFTMEPPA